MSLNGSQKGAWDADGLFRHAAFSRSRSAGVNLAIGVAAALTGILIRLILSAYFSGIGGFTIYLPPLLLAALIGGRIAGFTAFAILMAWGVWIGSATASPAPEPRLMIVGAASFLAAGVFCVEMAASLRRTIQGLQRAQAERDEAFARFGEVEQRFRLLSEDAPMMMWISDETGACIHLNRAQRKFWGAPEDLEGFDWSDTMDPDDRSRIGPVVAKALADHKPFEVEARYRRADGAERRPDPV